MIFLRMSFVNGPLNSDSHLVLLPVLERGELPGLAEELVRELNVLLLDLTKVLLRLLQLPYRHAPILVGKHI